MTKTIEVLFENQVFKPIHPVKGIGEHEMAWAIIRTKPRKSELLKMFGTLDPAEAKIMCATIDQEFESIEGQW